MPLVEPAVLDAAPPEVSEPDAIGFNLPDPSADTAFMEPERLAPMRSAREDDPDLSLAVDAFVVGLGAWIDDLQDAHIASEDSRVCQLVASQAAEALRVGYPLLAEAAQEVGVAAESDEVEAVRKGIDGLVELIQRIRLGHRSAA